MRENKTFFESNNVNLRSTIVTRARNYNASLKLSST